MTPQLLSFLSLLISFFLFSCSNYIEIVEGNFLKGKAIDHYKLINLAKNQSILIGKLKVIDNVGAISEEGSDITNLCSIIISDNLTYLEGDYSIANLSFITPSGISSKRDVSNNYKGNFIIKFRGQDAYIDGVICYNDQKFEQNFSKSDFYIVNKGQEIIGYDLEILSHVKIEGYNQIYDIGELNIAINKPDKAYKSSFRINSVVNFKENYNYEEIYQANFVKNLTEFKYNKLQPIIYKSNSKAISKRLKLRY